MKHQYLYSKSFYLSFSKRKSLAGDYDIEDTSENSQKSMYKFRSSVNFEGINVSNNTAKRDESIFYKQIDAIDDEDSTENLNLFQKEFKKLKNSTKHDSR